MAIALNPNVFVERPFLDPRDSVRKQGTGLFGQQYFEPIERITVRGGVLWPVWSQQQVERMQQKILPDQRYTPVNDPRFDVRYYTGVNFDIKEMWNKPRPLEGGLPYIPVAHILEQQPALNLFDNRVDQPNLFDVIGDPKDVNPTSQALPAQRRVEALERTRGYHLLNSRGAWNEYKQLEFIYRNRDQDPRLSIYRDNPIPIDMVSHEARLKERGLLRGMGGQR